MMFPFQRDIVRWALRRGKAAIFADCGLGKTPMQLEWAHQVHQYTGRGVLILAPLAVSQQTVREGEKFGITVHPCKTGRDVQPGVNISNYERLHHFDPAAFGGIVLDESSILKAQFGLLRHEITEFGRAIPYRLAASATPAPNDLVELINHAEFFGIMTEAEIKALFFTQDGNSSNTFRLKRHAEQDFWRWMASWSVALRRPSDLGYTDDGFILPPCHVHQVNVDLDSFQAGMLFAVEAVGLEEQRAARRASLTTRVAAAAELVNNSNEPWLVWCDLNDESAALAKAIPGAVEVVGSDSAEFKTAAMMGFSAGDHRVLVSKPSICGWGMNWQHCANVVFVGLSHSYEAYYQAVRRSWRFGQKRPVNVYVITSTAEGAVVASIERKEQQAMEMFDNIVQHMAVNTDLGAQTVREEMAYREDMAQGHDWQLYLGDSVKTIDHIATDSLGLSVFSPPFPGMYVYTNSPHDMGNVADIDQMIDQFSYLMGPDKLLRAMMPGRNVFIHITQGVAQKGRDGYIGLKDFRGKIIAMMQEHGWIYYGEAVIDKDPQLKAMRTKDHGLMFKSLVTDAARMHPALPDYLLQFRKPGDNPVPIEAGKVNRYSGNNGWVTSDQWILWARPVWYAADYMPGTWRPDYNGDGCDFGIRETDVLNVRQARDTNDERHLCPLQLGVIERVVKVWSAPGDIVYSPFAGIGSEGYVALKEGRKFIGGELKESYWRNAIRNLEAAISERGQGMLFDIAAD
jgi:superfamily II DNA or RNA helicase